MWVHVELNLVLNCDRLMSPCFVVYVTFFVLFFCVLNEASLDRGQFRYFYFCFFKKYF